MCPPLNIALLTIVVRDRACSALFQFGDLDTIADLPLEQMAEAVIREIANTDAASTSRENTNDSVAPGAANDTL